MKGGFLSALIILSLVWGFNCYVDSQLHINMIDLLTKRLDVVEQQMTIDKADLQNKQDVKILSLKTELMSDMRRLVTEALAGILRSESIEALIKSEVISEVRHLKRVNHHMRRELHQIESKLGRVQEDNILYREALKKGKGETCEVMTCSKYLVKSELLTVKLEERERKISELNKKINEHDQACQSAMVNRTVQSKMNSTRQSVATMSSVQESTTSTTPSPTEPERGRILIAPMLSSKQQYFRQVNIQRNSIAIYPHLNLRYVDSVTYVSKLKSFFIGLSTPFKIIKAKRNSSLIETVRHNVGTYGIAVDERRNIVFLTTRHPSFTISRMDLNGNHFSAIVSLQKIGRDPFGIAINTKGKIVYACNHDTLFSLRYDGSGLTIHNSGTNMHAVTLDITNGLLVYTKSKKLMKMSLSTNISSVVTEFEFKISNLVYNRDTVYYISHSKSPGTLGAVDMRPNIVSYELQTVEMAGAIYFAMCLIP